jgi:predicted metal-binding membrane protein
MTAWASTWEVPAVDLRFRRSDLIVLTVMAAALAAMVLAESHADPAAIGAGAIGMMGPLALPGTRHVFENSFRYRRDWSVVTFLAAFCGLWVGFGLVASGLLAIVADVVGPTTINASLVVALLVAAAWQVSPVKRRALRDCHRAVPLPPHGWPATSACLRYGAVFGVRCLLACGGLMLPMFAASQGHVFFGAFAMIAAVGERRVLMLRRSPVLVSAGLLAIGFLALTVGPDPASPVLGWVCAIPRGR